MCVFWMNLIENILIGFGYFVSLAVSLERPFVAESCFVSVLVV